MKDSFGLPDSTNTVYIQFQMDSTTDNTTSTRFKQVGKRRERPFSSVPSEALLNRGILFNDEMHRMFPPFGYLPRKRVLRFKTWEEANQHDHECLTRAMANRAAKSDGR
jgi:hypothetical protein